MTHPETPTEAALSNAGRVMGESLSDAGVRIVASAALSQIMAGLPAAARGMLATLHTSELRAVVAAITTALEIASDELPEARHAQATVEQTSLEQALGLFHGRLYSYAVAGNLDGIERGLAGVGTLDLYALHRGARQLLASIEQHLPQDGGPTSA